MAELLARYNDLKAMQEAKELPIRQVYLRRIGLKLVRIKAPGIPAQRRPAQSADASADATEEITGQEFLFRFPILEYVEEASKILLLNEFELLFWYNILVNYFTQYSQDAKAVQAITAKTVRLIFFQTGYFIKRFLMQMQKTQN